MNNEITKSMSITISVLTDNPLCCGNCNYNFHRDDDFCNERLCVLFHDENGDGIYLEYEKNKFIRLKQCIDIFK